MSKTSRRAILAGAATLPALAVPALANSLTAIAPTTTPIMRLCAELEEAKAEWDELSARYDRITKSVRAGLPPVPAGIRVEELTHSDFACLSEAERKIWPGMRHIEPRTIEIAIKEYGPKHVERTENAQGFTLSFTEAPLPMSPEAEARLSRLNERLSLANAYYQEERERLSRAGYDTVSEEMEENNDVGDIETEIAETPSTCVADLMAKVAVYEDSGEYDDLAKSIINDLKLLLGAQA